MEIIFGILIIAILCILIVKEVTVDLYIKAFNKSIKMEIAETKLKEKKAKK